MSGQKQGPWAPKVGSAPPIRDLYRLPDLVGSFACFPWESSIHRRAAVGGGRFGATVSFGAKLAWRPLTASRRTL